MALRVWLPLNGNLENKGVSNITATTIGTVSYDNSGKIGKAFISGGISQVTNGISLNSNLLDMLGTTASVAVWVKPNGTHFHYNGTIISSGNWNNSCWSFGVSQDNTKVDVFSGRYNRYINCTVPQGQWTHLVSIFDNGKCILYKNGEYIGELNGETSFISDASNACVGRETYANGYFGFNGLINDVRIYDHCLSKQEIKEISQGLILHYKLDGGINKNWLSDNSEKKIIRSSGNTFVDYNYYSDLTSCTDTSYTVNFYAKGSVEGMQLDVYFRNASGSAYALTAKQTLTTTWTYYSLPLTGSPANLQIFRARCYAGTAGDIIYIRNMQLLSNNVPIKNEIKDCSGYGNNGTIIGTLLTQQDTPRYELSTAFAASSAINCGRGAMVTDSITVNLWAKYSSYSNLMSCTEGGGWNFENNSGLTFPVYIAGIGYIHIDAAQRPAVTNYANDWHMFTGIYDRLNQLTKLYIDGELIGTGTVSSPNLIQYNGANVIWINAEATGSNTSGSYGNAKSISDVRIYATALSAEDIKLLYDTPTLINKQAGWHTFMNNEDNRNEISKNGLIHSSEISEASFAEYLKYDSNIYFEPDGSAWIHIYHHNNPSAGSFASNDTFTTSVYKDVDRWFNATQICNNIDKWEFLIKYAYTAGGTEYKERWIQTRNPETAVFGDVDAADITRITGNGYKTGSWGGLYRKNSSAYWVMNNGNSGNWWGAVGSFSIYQGGIPGYGGTVTTTGFNDLYVRIDNVDFLDTDEAKITKNGIYVGNNFVER